MDQAKAFLEENKTLVLGLLVAVLLYCIYRYRQAGQNMQQIQEEAGYPQQLQQPQQGQGQPQRQQGQGQGQRACILFHANWCGHCKAMKPAWQKLEQKYGQTYNLQSYEADEDKEFIKQNEITGFPTIRLIKEDGSVHEYDGDRSFESLEKFLTH